jgi:5'-3' exonuclease
MDASLTLLVDSASLIYRAFFSTPGSVTAPDGRPMNAAHGFFGMLARLVADINPDYLCCAADEAWRPQWRVDLIPSYKSHRADDPEQQKIDRQVDVQTEVIFEFLQRCGVAVAGHPDHEAEDVIGTLVARCSDPVAIVSGDRDLFQLVRDPNVFVLFPRRGIGRMDFVDEAYIEKKYGIPAHAYRDFAVLRGDPSDGLPGARGIGEKTASSLLSKHGSLEAVLEAAASSPNRASLGKVNASREYLQRAVSVTTIRSDLPIAERDLTRPRSEIDPAVVEDAAKYGLSGALRRLGAALSRRKAD